MADAPSSDPLAWQARKAPSLDELHVIAEEAYRRLPANFRALCDGLVIHVEDFPTDEVLDELNAETEFDLLGLFQGVGLPFRSESAPAHMPNMVWLYRRPILTTGPSTTRPWAPSSPMYWCTRSGTISGSPTTT